MRELTDQKMIEQTPTAEPKRSAVFFRVDRTVSNPFQGIDFESCRGNGCGLIDREIRMILPRRTW
jgi:hypothetical protein